MSRSSRVALVLWATLAASCAAEPSSGGEGKDPAAADFVGAFSASDYIAAVAPFWEGDQFAAQRFETCPCRRTAAQVGPLGGTDLVRAGPSEQCVASVLSGTLLDSQGLPTGGSRLIIDFYLPQASWRDYLCLPYLHCLWQAEQLLLAEESLQACRDAALFHCEEQGVYHYCSSEAAVAPDSSFALDTVLLGKARLTAQVPELGENAEPGLDIEVAQSNVPLQLKLVEKAWGWELVMKP